MAAEKVTVTIVLPKILFYFYRVLLFGVSCPITKRFNDNDVEDFLLL